MALFSNDPRANTRNSLPTYVEKYNFLERFEMRGFERAHLERILPYSAIAIHKIAVVPDETYDPKKMNENRGQLYIYDCGRRVFSAPIRALMDAYAMPLVDSDARQSSASMDLLVEELLKKTVQLGANASGAFMSAVFDKLLELQRGSSFERGHRLPVAISFEQARDVSIDRSNVNSVDDVLTIQIEGVWRGR